MVESPHSVRIKSGSCRSTKRCTVITAGSADSSMTEHSPSTSTSSAPRRPCRGLTAESPSSRRCITWSGGSG